ncbi:MAG: DUF1573 domain-containing protein [Candidatus Heimdallarchaeota archaeon]
MILVLFSCKENKTNNRKEIKTIERKERLSSLNDSRRLTELTNIKFDTKLVDLGEIKEGDTTLTGRYIFKNTGSHPLLIEYVNPDCTCTDYEFTKDTISIGDEGFINLTYNIKNKIGNQKLYAVVKANTDASFYKLILKLNIIESK